VSSKQNVQTHNDMVRWTPDAIRSIYERAGNRSGELPDIRASLASWPLPFI